MCVNFFAFMGEISLEACCLSGLNDRGAGGGSAGKSDVEMGKKRHKSTNLSRREVKGKGMPLLRAASDGVQSGGFLV